MAKAENNFLSEQTIKFQDLLGKKKAEMEVLEEKVKSFAGKIVNLYSIASAVRNLILKCYTG